MKQTAVEWLHEIAKQREPDKFDWQQAKEMEKQQIIESYDEAENKVIGNGEKYYNKTFK